MSGHCAGRGRRAAAPAACREAACGGARGRRPASRAGGSPAPGVASLHPERQEQSGAGAGHSREGHRVMPGHARGRQRLRPSALNLRENKT